MKKTILFLTMFIFTCVCLLPSNVYAYDSSDVEIISDEPEKIGYNNKKTEYKAGNASKEDIATESKTKSNKQEKEKTSASKTTTNQTNDTNNTNYNKQVYTYKKEYTPKTSDDSYINLSIGLFLVSIVGMSIVVYVKKSEKRACKKI